MTQSESNAQRPRTDDTTRAMLRHSLATLAYRGAKAVRKAEITTGRVGPNQSPPRREFD